MNEIKTIKDIDSNTWAEFKSIAARNNLKLGELFKAMLKEYEHKSRQFWDDILTTGKILSDGEAEDMQRIVAKIRKERGFRI